MNGFLKYQSIILSYGFIRRCSIFIFVIVLSSISAFAQYFSIYSIDDSASPKMRAKFFAFDEQNKQIVDFNLSDIKVFEDEIEQTVTTISCTPNLVPIPISSVLTIDVSGSMEGLGLNSAKAASLSWIDALDFNNCECAITSFAETNYFNQDFTIDSDELKNAVNSLVADGGTSFDEAFISPMAGAFLAAEKALYKKVVVMITDGNATGNAEEIIKKAKELDITVFTVVLNIKCPPILKAIALQTGGQWFENVNGKQEAKEIYQKILKMAQGADPCEIEWDSDIPCSSSRRFVEIQYQDESSIDSYLPSLDYIAKLNYSPSYINFGGVTPWEERNTTLTITAKNADFLITDISLKYGSENYTIEDIEYPFPIFEGESEEISIHFAPDDSTYNYAVFDIVSDVCPFQFSVHGGYPEVDITEPTIELIFPNGGEELVVGSDTSITWQGLSVNDNITIQYSTDQGANWLSVIESANNLNYIWKSIPATTSDNCLVKIKQTNEETPGDIDWEKSFGGDSLDNIYSSIVKTYDGGYIVAGTTFSTDGDIDSAHKGGSDYWVMKFNSSFDLEWQKCYGGSSDDDASSIIQTVDNGYAVVGCTWSNDGDVTNNNGDYDFWVVKLDAIGDIQWQKCYGGSKWDRATSIVQTTDGGFVITGDSFSSDGDIDKNRGGSDILVLKVDVDGGLEWSKSFGGEARGDDGANSIIQTLDGGYVVGGYTWTEVGSIAGKGANDFWIIKLDANGKEEWDKILGGTDWDFGRSVIQTLDGGYIGAGYSKSIDGDIVGNNGHDDIWAVKLNSIGDTQWSRVYGGAGNDHASSIMQTPTGSYVIVGETYSNDGDITENKGGYDYWLLKLGEFGDLLWQRTYGGSSNDCAKSLIQTSDAGYIVAGDTWSDDGDVSINYGQSDFWFLKISPEGLPVQSDVSDVVFSIVMPEITVNNIDMGDVFIGSRQYADVQNYIVNSGDYRIRIDTAYISNGDGDLFYANLWGFPIYLEAGEELSVEFSFLPDDIGYKEVELTIITQADSLVRKIYGRGIQPQIEIVNKIIDFGLVDMANEQWRDTLGAITIRNIGNTSLEIDSVNNGLPNINDFSILDGNEGFILEADESAELDLRFTPSESGRTTGALEFYYQGEKEPAIVQLHGEGFANSIGYLSLSLPDLTASPGTLLNIPISLRNQYSLYYSGVTSLETELHFNPTILYPTDSIFTVLNDTTASIAISGMPIADTSGWRLTDINFEVALGNRISSILSLENVQSIGGSVIFTIENGSVALDSLCHEGGTRLFAAADTSQGISTITPNPASNHVEIEIYLIRNGYTELSIFDIMGRKIKTVFEEDVNLEENEKRIIPVDISKIGQGQYVLLFKNSTFIQQTPMMIVK